MQLPRLPHQDDWCRATAQIATVFFATATYGIGAKGTMFRIDRISLRARQIVNLPLTTDEAVLLQLLSRLPDRQAHSAFSRRGRRWRPFGA